jgi:ribosomal protein S27E
MASERAESRRAPSFIDPPGYARHRPGARLLYVLVERHYPQLIATRETAGRPLPKYVQAEFEAYLKCGRFEHGFLRVRCEDCRSEKLVAFSCKRRGFCPSCGARRMTESAALLVDEVLPKKPLRQWALSLPFALPRGFSPTPPRARPGATTDGNRQQKGLLYVLSAWPPAYDMAISVKFSHIQTP